MLKDIAYFLIFGKPLVMYVGIVTLLSFAFTASIAILNKKGITKIPFTWHPKMAQISFFIATVHAVLALSLFF